MTVSRGGPDDIVVVVATAPVAPAAGTAPGALGAAALAERLVAERLCACASVLPRMTSWFHWQGSVDRADEHLLLLKTTRARVPQLQQRLVELHPYEVPEFLVFGVDTGLPAYLAWVAASTAAGPRSE